MQQILTREVSASSSVDAATYRLRISAVLLRTLGKIERLRMTLQPFWHMTVHWQVRRQAEFLCRRNNRSSSSSYQVVVHSSCTFRVQPGRVPGRLVSTVHVDHMARLRKLLEPSCLQKTGKTFHFHCRKPASVELICHPSSSKRSCTHLRQNPMQHVLTPRQRASQPMRDPTANPT